MERYIQDQESAKHRRRQTECENAGVQALELSVGYGELGRCRECMLEIEVGRVDGVSEKRCGVDQCNDQLDA